MPLDETDPLVLENMEGWATLTAERFEKESCHVPHAVAIMAAIQYIVSRTKRSSVVTPAAVLKILEGQFEEENMGGFNAVVPQEEN